MNVQSFMSGIYFSVDTQQGLEETLTASVTPPGPASFLHNAANTSELVRRRVNGYVQANKVREFVLQQNPAYPTIATQTLFPVRVNRIDVIAPATPGTTAGRINFCQSALYAGTHYPNTAWQSVVFHEYGHHAVNSGGSGQGAYGEGMGDCIAIIPYDDPIAAYGFFGDCLTGLRTADNTLQYPCSGEIHDCGQLLSACVWSTRNQLVITEPVNYLTLLASLTVNSILLHSGDQITPQIAIDFLTLDDDDANLYNGTPHFNEITTGFAAHSMWTGLPPAVDLPISLLAQFDGTGAAAYAVALAGDYAYVADGAAGLLIENVSDPSLPAFVQTVHTIGPAYGVALAGAFAYVAEGEAGLEIFDVSDPGGPVWRGLFDTDGFAWGVAVAGQFAFVADDFAGLVMIDVSDPTAPFWQDAYMTKLERLQPHPRGQPHLRGAGRRRSGDIRRDGPGGPRLPRSLPLQQVCVWGGSRGPNRVRGRRYCRARGGRPVESAVAVAARRLQHARQRAGRRRFRALRLCRGWGGRPGGHRRRQPGRPAAVGQLRYAGPRPQRGPGQLRLCRRRHGRGRGAACRTRRRHEL